MEGYAEVLAADRRLVILRLLVEAGGESGESALEKGLHMLGHRTAVDRDQVRKDLRELEARGCVEIEFYDAKVMIGAITRRGVSVAEGKVVVAGVAKPTLGR